MGYQYIEELNKTLQSYTLNDKAKKDIILTFQIWEELYRILYFCASVQSYRIDQKTKLDWNGVSQSDLWKEVSKYVDQKLLDELMLYVEMLPSPVEQEGDYSIKVLEIVNKFIEGRKSQKIEVLDDFIKRLITCVPSAERPFVSSKYSDTFLNYIKRKYEMDARLSVTAPFLNLFYQKEKIQDCYLGDITFYIPSSIPWQSSGGRPNFYIHQSDNMWRRLEQLLITLLLSFPIGRMKLIFVNIDYSNGMVKVRRKLCDELCESEILSLEELDTWMQKSRKDLRDSFAQVGDFIEHNVEQGKILGYYKICIISGLSSSERTRCERLSQLIERGQKAGLYFVVLGDVLVNNNECLFNEMTDDTINLTENIFIPFENEADRELLFKFITKTYWKNKMEIQKKETERLMQLQETQYGTPFQDATKEFSVEIGINVVTGASYSYHLDEINHVHSFVLGTTGSGKSVFLHILLNQAMLKYGPDTLQFYLMDFKEGGVELNRYKAYPHVRALLVDESDPNITLEIFRDIKDLMEKRGKTMAAANCRNFVQYNTLNPDKPMPRIVLLVDECHSLFKDDRYKIQKEINNIVEHIAKQGRNQGIHIIFSTQTLSGTFIPEAVIKLTDPYIMRSSVIDASRFVSNASFVLDGIAKYSFSFDDNNSAYYRCFYHKDVQTGNDDFVQPIYYTDEQMDKALSAIKIKSSSFKSDFNPFYFSGTLFYQLQEGIEYQLKTKKAGFALGRSLEIKSRHVSVVLRKELAQNLLIIGNNSKWQAFRIWYNALWSVMEYNREAQIQARYLLFLNDNLEDEPHLEGLVNTLRERGVQVVDTSKIGEQYVKELYEQVENGDESVPTYIVVSSQEKYSSLRQKRSVLIEAGLTSLAHEREHKEEQVYSELKNRFYDKNRNSSSDRVRSRPVPLDVAWKKILSVGPEKNIFTIWQLDNFSKLLFMPSVFVNEVYEYFLHIAFLRTLSDIAMKFNIDEIRLDELNDSPEKLRICYLNGNDNLATLLSPYQMPTINLKNE